MTMHVSMFDGPQNSQWYDLFSRGARDWLRHNEKVRTAVRDQLSDLVAGADILSGPGDRTVQVPVRFLEHFRFRLSEPAEQNGVGQGDASAGDRLRPPERAGDGSRGEGGNNGGGYRFVLDLKVDDIVDWLWEELELPNLEARSGGLSDDEFTREGWDRRGARSRLDRRRTLRETIKRRSVAENTPPISNDDLRFRQLVKRQRPATRAALLFALDASSSMSHKDRQLAKAFFFWALQGLRRQYGQIEMAFIAHTVEAWEFTEDEFFKVTGQGGTVASSAFRLAGDIIDQRFDPARYNIYLMYASDGDNFREDRAAAEQALAAIGTRAQFLAYVETAPGSSRGSGSETSAIFESVRANGAAADTFQLTHNASVWDAIRHFFTAQNEAAA